MRVTDVVDITTIKDYMKVVKLLRSGAREVHCSQYAVCLVESLAYMGGRENYCRTLTLDG